MTDKQIIIDGVDVSNFCLVCYYDNKTNELARIEPYYDNDTSMYSDIDSYRYGYNAEITKPEEIIKQLKRKEQEYEELKNIINEAQNSKLDLKSFLVGEAIQNEYQQQLDQAIAQREAFWAMYRTKHGDLADKYEKLKAENEKIEQCIIEQNRLVVGMTKEIETLTFKKYELLQTLTEIKEIANYSFNLSTSELMAKLEQILQKTSEVEVC